MQNPGWENALQQKRNINDVKHDIEVSLNLQRIHHNHRLDDYSNIMKENERLLNKLLEAPISVLDKNGIKERKKDLKRLLKIAQGMTSKTDVFYRSRANSVFNGRISPRQSSLSQGGSINLSITQKQDKGQLEISESQNYS